MYAALLFYVLNLLIPVHAANNEFIIPSPIGGMNVTEGEPVEINWRCDDCRDAVRLGVFQARDDADGTWAEEFFFSK